MKIQPKKLQQAAESALSAKRGLITKEDLQGLSEKMYEHMPEHELQRVVSEKKRSKPQKESNL